MKEYPYALPVLSRNLFTVRVLCFLLGFLNWYTMLTPIFHIWKCIFQTAIQKVSMKNV